MGETCWEYANGQKIQYMGKNVSRGLSAPAPGLYIHVYYHNIQISSSLKPFGQSKPNVMWSILRKGE